MPSEAAHCKDTQRDDQVKPRYGVGRRTLEDERAIRPQFA